MPKPVTQEGAFHMRIAHEIRCRLVDFFRCNARSNKVAHSVQNVARSAARLAHLVDFSRVLDWYHGVLLPSINREISLKTASRSRFPSIRCKIDIF
jgi:hypothetical protein